MALRSLAPACAALLALAAGVGGCGEPPSVDPPFTSEVLSHLGGGKYEVRAEPLETLRDFATMSGDAARIRGGGFVRVDEALDADTDEELRRALRVRGDSPLRLDYRVQGGVVRAYDYDTFAVLTLYRAIEKTRAFYLQVGVRQEELPPLPVWFRPRLEVFFLPLLASNNAAYSPPIDGFLFFNDFFGGSGVPLALNLGVVGHEYGHAVFQHLVWRDRLPPWTTQSWPNQPVNHMRALDEGLADVYGAALTMDPAFVARSVSMLAEERDLSRPRVLTVQDLAATGSDPALFDPYRLGSIVAGALWGATSAVEPMTLVRYVAEAQRRLSGRVTQAFQVTTFLDALTAVATPPHRAALCASYAERLAAAGPFACCEGRCP